MTASVLSSYHTVMGNPSFPSQSMINPMFGFFQAQQSQANTLAASERAPTFGQTSSQNSGSRAQLMSRSDSQPSSTYPYGRRYNSFEPPVTSSRSSRFLLTSENARSSSRLHLDRRPSEAAATAVAQHRVEEWTKRHYSVAQLPRREISEPMFKKGPVRSIDSTTEIPEDLFESLLRRGDERRRAGQHVLAKRSQKLGGGVKLVHPERLEYMKSSSRYNQASSRYNLALAARGAGA